MPSPPITARANMNHGVLLLDQPGISAFQTIVRTTRIEQTRSQLSETINRKSTQAARLYFENLASLSRVAVLQEAVRISKRILNQEKKLMELGGASIVGVLRAAHEVARDSRHLVEEERKTYRVAFRLSQIMGIDANTMPVPEESFILPRLYIRLPDDPDRLIELSDEKRPLLREFEKKSPGPGPGVVRNSLRTARSNRRSQYPEWSSRAGLQWTFRLQPDPVLRAMDHRAGRPFRSGCHPSCTNTRTTCRGPFGPNPDPGPPSGP